MITNKADTLNNIEAGTHENKLKAVRTSIPKSVLNILISTSIKKHRKVSWLCNFIISQSIEEIKGSDIKNLPDKTCVDFPIMNPIFKFAMEKNISLPIAIGIALNTGLMACAIQGSDAQKVLLEAIDKYKNSKFVYAELYAPKLYKDMSAIKYSNKEFHEALLKMTMRLDPTHNNRKIR